MFTLSDAQGDHFFVVMGEDQRCLAFGCNTDGQLGIGKCGNLKRPTQPEVIKIEDDDGRTVVDGSCGGCHSLLLLDDGTAISAGSNQYGQLGTDDDVETQRSTFEAIECKTPVQAVACGRDFSLMLGKDGTLYSFGRGEHGQLGLGASITCVAVPTIITKNLKFRLIAAGDQHCVAVTKGEDERVLTWGCGGSGRLGQSRDQSVDQDRPAEVDKDKIKLLESARLIACGKTGTSWSCPITLRSAGGCCRGSNSRATNPHSFMSNGMA